MSAADLPLIGAAATRAREAARVLRTLPTETKDAALTAMAEALLGVQTGYTGKARSMFYRWFTDPAERRRFPAGDRDRYSRVYASNLRAVVARDPDDHEARTLVDDLRRTSSEFQRIWEAHEVGLSLTEDSLSEVLRYVLVYLPGVSALLGVLVMLERRKREKRGRADALKGSSE